MIKNIIRDLKKQAYARSIAFERAELFAGRVCGIRTGENGDTVLKDKK